MKNFLDKANIAIASQAGFENYLQTSSAKESYYLANFPQSTATGVGRYAQANMQVTLTSSGVRLYSPPNHDGRPSGQGGSNDDWGGLVLSPMKTYNCLVNGHRYIILWHCVGKTSTALAETSWSNQIGWGQSPDASPTVNRRCVPAAGFQGTMECCYDFTINDTIFKTTGSSVHSGFEANTSYLAYAAFKIGFGYRQTGELGTDLYLSNFRMYDITSGVEELEFTHKGLLNTTEIIELSSDKFSTAQIQQSGDIISNEIYEY